MGPSRLVEFRYMHELAAFCARAAGLFGNGGWHFSKPLQPARDGHALPPFGFPNTVSATSDGSLTTCR
jgi:hypothetical protein